MRRLHRPSGVLSSGLARFVSLDQVISLWRQRKGGKSFERNDLDGLERADRWGLPRSPRTELRPSKWSSVDEARQLFPTSSNLTLGRDNRTGWMIKPGDVAPR